MKTNKNRKNAVLFSFKVICLSCNTFLSSFYKLNICHERHLTELYSIWQLCFWCPPCPKITLLGGSFTLGNKKTKSTPWSQVQWVSNLHHVMTCQQAEWAELAHPWGCVEQMLHRSSSLKNLHQNITDHLPVDPTTILGLSNGLQPLVQKTF